MLLIINYLKSMVMLLLIVIQCDCITISIIITISNIITCIHTDKDTVKCIPIRIL